MAQISEDFFGYFIEGPAQVCTGGPGMAATTKMLSDQGNVHLSIGAESHFEKVGTCFPKKKRNFNTTN